LAGKRLKKGLSKRPVPKTESMVKIRVAASMGSPPESHCLQEFHEEDAVAADAVVVGEGPDAAETQ
jgi:hypothetical protein